MMRTAISPRLAISRVSKVIGVPEGIKASEVIGSSR